MSRPQGPPCGNNPNVRLTSEDQKAVGEFKAYLASRPRCAGCGHRAHGGAVCRIVAGRDECGCEEADS